MSRPRDGLVICLVMATALTAWIGRGVILQGKTFTPTDFWTTHPLWGGTHASDAEVQNRIHQDPIQFDAMHAIAAHESLREGRFFLWNPYIECGLPSLGDPQLGTFYVPRLAFLRWLPPLSALDGLILLHYLAAGLAMYALAVTWGMSVSASLTAALVWMLCGQQMVWFKYAGGLPAAAYLPVLAMALRRGLTRSSFGWMAGAGGLWALLLTAAHPQLSFLALIWTVIELGCQGRTIGWKKTLSHGAVFAGVAVGLGAVQLFPLISSLASSQKLLIQDSLSFPKPARMPLLLGTLFWQRAFGSPLDRVDLIPSWTGTNFFEFQGYIGLLPLLMALLAWKRSPKLSMTALLVLAVATLYPLWWILTTLVPLLKMLVPHRLFLFAFAASLLAGLGLDRLLESPPGRRLMRVSVSVTAVILLAGSVGWAKSATWLTLSNPAYFALAIACLLGTLALRVLASPAHPSLKLAAVWIAVAGDLLPGFLSYNSAYPQPPHQPAELARLSRVDRVLVDIQSNYYRIGCDNYLMAYRLSTPSGYSSQHPRVLGEMAQALGASVSDRRIQFPPGALRALKALNVHTVLTARAPLTLDSLPRGWLVGRYELIPEPGRRLSRLADPAFDLSKAAILEEPAAPIFENPSGSVERIGDLDYEVTSDRPCLLVVSETFDPGWHARVDGLSQQVLRVNHAMRGVVLPAGRHRIEFRFFPLSLTLGLGCAGATGILLLIWAVIHRSGGVRIFRA